MPMNKPTNLPRATTWSPLATPDAGRRESWMKAGDPTRWAACGRQWDAVAITPLAMGLEALDRMDLSSRCGYPVLADHIRGVLYVLVPSGADVGADLPAGTGCRACCCRGTDLLTGVAGAARLA
jgi:hypothetical protein